VKLESNVAAVKTTSTTKCIPRSPSATSCAAASLISAVSYDLESSAGKFASGSIEIRINEEGEVKVLGQSPLEANDQQDQCLSKSLKAIILAAMDFALDPEEDTPWHTNLLTMAPAKQPQDQETSRWQLMKKAHQVYF
jgi:hypothetical protein